MKRTESSKPVAKSTNTTQKKVPTAASKATPQPPPVEGRKLRSSARVPPSNGPQDQLQTIDESAATTTDSTQLTLPWSTRFGRQKAADIRSATLIIKGQIEKLRDYIPATQSSRSASQTRGIKKQLQRDVVQDINDFYSALARTEMFNSAKPNGDGPDLESGSATEIEFGAGGFVGYMQEDFKKQLVSDSNDDRTGKVIRNAMSFDLRAKDTGSDAQNEDEGGSKDEIKGKEKEEDGDKGNDKGESEGDDDGDDDGVENDSDDVLMAKIDELMTTFEEVRQMVEENIVSRSFSTIQKKHYPQLGIREGATVPALTLCLKVVKGLVSRQLFPAKVTATWAEVLKQMEKRTVTTIDSFWNILSEESTRLLVNDVKYCLVASALMFHGEDSKILCFPEFSLGSRGRPNAKDSVAKSGTAVTIKNKRGHTTRLTGSTDYFTFSMLDQQKLDLIKTERSLWAGSTVELYDRLVKLWAEFSLESEGFVIVEAKSPLTKVESHIPQVVAEAIALGDRRQKDYVPFCLTSGMDWIFGIVFCGDDERVVRRTTPMPFRPTQGGILLIIALVLTWTSTSPNILWKTLESKY